MKHLAYGLMIFLFLAGIGFAASDTMMLVTDITSVDSATASAAASKAGVPVIVLENGLLTDVTKSKLSGVKNVILVGGPVVIKPQVEKGLRDSGYNVIRLWGFERTGTAVAVSRYFWPEGASCVVLVDDTKNSDADSRMQMAASNLATRFNCTFIPVPEGSVPTEVMALFDDLGIKDIRFVGKRISLEARNKLRGFMLKEIIGDDDGIENEIEDNITNSTRNPKLVIVATPDWKAAVAIGSHPNEHSVVRQISDVSQVARIIDFIKAHNVTDVRVVGIPSLVDRIADMLAAANITAAKFSGQKASEISEKIFEHEKDEWSKLKIIEDENRLKLSFKIKAFLEDDINDTITRLNAVLTQLDSLNTTADIANAKLAIEAAKARITEVRNLLQSGDIDGARRLLFEIRFVSDEKKFEMRDQLRIKLNDEVKGEENGIDDEISETEQSIEAVESRLGEISMRCANTGVINSVINKIRALRASIQEAKASGNFTSAASQSIHARELVKIAKSTVEICREHGKLSDMSDRITKEVMKMRAGIVRDQTD